MFKSKDEKMRFVLPIAVYHRSQTAYRPTSKLAGRSAHEFTRYAVFGRLIKMRGETGHPGL